MRSLVLLIISVMVGWAEEENSAQRLENAQQGMAEATWPRKPDSRLSSLDGKMKKTREISARYYGQEREWRAKTAQGWSSEATTTQERRWGNSSRQGWENLAWEKGQENAQIQSFHTKFLLNQSLAREKTLTWRDLDQDSAPSWTSRSARLGLNSSGALRMYEGRLTRVRKQVWLDEEAGKDLGAGRKEKFSPQEVEQMLSNPGGAGQVQGGATEQSLKAKPHTAVGN